MRTEGICNSTEIRVFVSGELMLASGVYPAETMRASGAVETAVDDEWTVAILKSQFLSWAFDSGVSSANKIRSVNGSL